jgi:hypothetical protein
MRDLAHLAREEQVPVARLLAGGKAATVPEARRLRRPAEDVSNDAFSRIHNLLDRLTKEDARLLAGMLAHLLPLQEEYRQLQEKYRQLQGENLELHMGLIKAQHDDLHKWIDDILPTPRGEGVFRGWYRKMSGKYHPDRHCGDTVPKEEVMREINALKQALQDLRKG